MTQTCYNIHNPRLSNKINTEDAQLILKLNNYGDSNNSAGYATAQETRTDIQPELPDDHLTSLRYVIHAVTAKYGSRVTMPTCATWIEILL